MPETQTWLEGSKHILQEVQKEDIKQTALEMAAPDPPTRLHFRLCFDEVYPKSVYPKPRTRNPKPETQNPKPENLYPKPGDEQRAVVQGRRPPL